MNFDLIDENLELRGERAVTKIGKRGKGASVELFRDRQVVSPSPIAQDRQLARQLWEESEELCQKGASGHAPGVT